MVDAIEEKNEDAETQLHVRVTLYPSSGSPALVPRKEDSKGLIVRPIERSYMMDIMSCRKPRRLWEYLDTEATRWV